MPLVFEVRWSLWLEAVQHRVKWTKLRRGWKAQPLWSIRHFYDFLNIFDLWKIKWNSWKAFLQVLTGELSLQSLFFLSDGFWTLLDSFAFGEVFRMELLIARQRGSSCDSYPCCCHHLARRSCRGAAENWGGRETKETDPERKMMKNEDSVHTLNIKSQGSKLKRCDFWFTQAGKIVHAHSYNSAIRALAQQSDTEQARRGRAGEIGLENTFCFILIIRLWPTVCRFLRKIEILRVLLWCFAGPLSNRWSNLSRQLLRRSPDVAAFTTVISASTKRSSVSGSKEVSKSSKSSQEIFWVFSFRQQSVCFAQGKEFRAAILLLVRLKVLRSLLLVWKRFSKRPSFLIRGRDAGSRPFGEVISNWIQELVACAKRGLNAIERKSFRCSNTCASP